MAGASIEITVDDAEVIATLKVPRSRGDRPAG